MGHQQLAFFKSDWKSRYSHGGVLRKKQSGRGIRPLSNKDPLHVVFKAERACLREKSLRGYRSFSAVQKLVKKYATKTTQSGTNLWKYRPFSRIVRSWRAYQIVRNYIQLNEKEARGQIKYNSQRLKGLSAGDWQILWA